MSQREKSESEYDTEQERLKRKAAARPVRVVITEVKIPFSSWVGLLVTITFASIPAAIIVVAVIWGVIRILASFAGK